MSEIRFFDFLAGGGGVTHAATKIDNVDVVGVLNHDPMAIRTNLFHHKGVKHYFADIYLQNEKEIDPVDVVWASIECTQHSRANGGKNKKEGSYTLGFELLRYLKHLDPLIIGIENVPEFKDWSPLDEDGHPDKSKKGEEFKRWKQSILDMGYEYSEHICNARDYGLPTRRVRYFAIFYKSYLNFTPQWPAFTHNKNGENGLKKWEACKNYIDLDREGNSIFGRELNPDVPKGKRKPLSQNTMKRIAGGIKKYAPELYFIFQYYGSGLNVQSIDSPLNTVTTKDRHVLVKMEKIQFIADHCHTDNYTTIEEPVSPQLTRQLKQIVSLDIQFLNDYYGRSDTAHDLNGPANTIRTNNSKNVVSVKANFISSQYNSSGNPAANNNDIEKPLSAITSNQKHQFITTYFSNVDNNQAVDKPLNSILTGVNKKALVTAIEEGLIDFDIKMRFLDPEELSQISSFPPGYFTNPLLKLTKKEQTKLIGNAVPTEWARILLEPHIEELKRCLKTNKKAV